MSVNLTVDGTTYSDASAITVGGKTITITESGTASGVASGSFTPDENKLNLSWDMGGNYTNIVIRKASNAVTYGVRTCLMVSSINGLTAFVGTNNAGSVATGGTGNTELSISGSTVTYTGRTASGAGYLVPETYYWFAW